MTSLLTAIHSKRTTGLGHCYNVRTLSMNIRSLWNKSGNGPTFILCYSTVLDPMSVIKNVLVYSILRQELIPCAASQCGEF